MKYDNKRLGRSINGLLGRVQHSTSYTYAETHPTFTFIQMNKNSWLLMWNLPTWLSLVGGKKRWFVSKRFSKSCSIIQKFQLNKITNFNVTNVHKKNTHFGGAARSAVRWILI